MSREAVSSLSMEGFKQHVDANFLKAVESKFRYQMSVAKQPLGFLLTLNNCDPRMYKKNVCLSSVKCRSNPRILQVQLQSWSVMQSTQHRLSAFLRAFSFFLRAQAAHSSNLFAQLVCSDLEFIVFFQVRQTACELPRWLHGVPNSMFLNFMVTIHKTLHFHLELSSE